MEERPVRYVRCPRDAGRIDMYRPSCRDGDGKAGWKVGWRGWKWILTGILRRVREREKRKREAEGRLTVCSLKTREFRERRLEERRWIYRVWCTDLRMRIEKKNQIRVWSCEEGDVCMCVHLHIHFVADPASQNMNANTNENVHRYIPLRFSRRLYVIFLLYLDLGLDFHLEIEIEID